MTSLAWTRGPLGWPVRAWLADKVGLCSLETLLQISSLYADCQFALLSNLVLSGSGISWAGGKDESGELHAVCSRKVGGKVRLGHSPLGKGSLRETVKLWEDSWKPLS